MEQYTELSTSPNDESNCNTITLASGGQRIIDNVNRLIETFTACSMENWDGYDALPVKPEAFADAKRFIESLPSNVPMPTYIDADPNGGIIMEWRKGKGKVFVVDFYRSNKIVYAGIRGDTECKGTIIFTGAGIAEEIIENIQLPDCPLFQPHGIST